MQIAVITKNTFEPIFENINTDFIITYYNNINLLKEKVTIIVDFSYENIEERDFLLNKFSSITFVNNVLCATSESNKNFIFFNGWSSLCEKPPLEICNVNQANTKLVEKLTLLGIQYIAVAKGMVTPKVVSMLINEAYFALGEGVSSKEEIDIAMQLGTNYPYGPFAWSKKIGLHNVYNLLNNLSENDERYIVAPLLLKEINN